MIKEIVGLRKVCHGQDITKKLGDYCISHNYQEKDRRLNSWKMKESLY